MPPISILILGILAQPEVHDNDFIIGTAIGQGVLLSTYLIREWFKERDRRWQREHDTEDRERERLAQAKRLEETRNIVVAKVEETQAQLKDGVTSNLQNVLQKFDEMPDAVANKAAERAAEPIAKKVAEDVAEHTANKVVEKLKNGPHS